jgi:hypothetical protein
VLYLGVYAARKLPSISRMARRTASRYSNFQWSFYIKYLDHQYYHRRLSYSTHPCHACTSVSNNHHTCANMCVNSRCTRSPASAITSFWVPQGEELFEGVKRKHDGRPPWNARHMSYQKHSPRLLEATNSVKRVQRTMSV